MEKMAIFAPQYFSGNRLKAPRFKGLQVHGPRRNCATEDENAVGRQNMTLIQYIQPNCLLIIFFLWQHHSSISDPRRSERTKRPTSFTTCSTPPATNSNGCAADTHRTAGVALPEAPRYLGAKWRHGAICHQFLPSGISLPFFSYFRHLQNHRR